MGRYAEGILLLAIALIPLQTAAYLWRSRLLGGWTGAEARLAEIIIDLTVVVCVSELLGAAHLYRVGPVVGLLAAIGVAAIWAAKRSSRNLAFWDTDASDTKIRASPCKHRGPPLGCRRRRRMEHENRRGLPPRHLEHRLPLVPHARSRHDSFKTAPSPLCITWIQRL